MVLKKFVVLFHDLLRTQLILKNIVTPEDWDNDMSELVKYDFIQDGYYSEIKMQNNTMEKAELFAVSSEVAISSK